MPVKMQPIVKFDDLPANAVFRIEWDMDGQAGPASALVFEDPQHVDRKTAMKGSVKVEVGFDCEGRIRIPINGNTPKGKIIYRVTDAAGKDLQPPKEKELSLVKPKLKTGDIYVGRSRCTSA